MFRPLPRRSNPAAIRFRKATVCPRALAAQAGGPFRDCLCLGNTFATPGIAGFLVSSEIRRLPRWYPEVFAYSASLSSQLRKAWSPIGKPAALGDVVPPELAERTFDFRAGKSQPLTLSNGLVARFEVSVKSTESFFEFPLYLFHSVPVEGLSERSSSHSLLCDCDCNCEGIATASAKLLFFLKSDHRLIAF
jgi:hypothetical protein